MTATGEDAFLDQVAREIEEARAMKPGIIELADRVLKYFVPGVLTTAALSFAFWLVAPLAWGGAPNVQRGAFAALAVLVLGYPCALGMATPLALIRGGGKAANRGILTRSGDAFQIFPDVDHIVLDKTGTITVGEPAVSEIVGVGEEETDVLATAASAEAFSEHPLADAILNHANNRGVQYPDPDSFDSVTGKGVRATVERAARSVRKSRRDFRSPSEPQSGSEDAANWSSGDGGEPRDSDDILVGKPGWLEAEGVALANAGNEIEQLQRRGLTVSGVVRDGDLVGLIGIGDEIKDDAAGTVQRMTDAGITPVMITGDNERTARAVAEAVGIERVMADVLPDEKREEIGRLQDDGERTTGSRTSSERRSDGSHRVAMVGDGINDAPALTQADIGIAIGTGTDIAIESADIVLMGERLGGVMDAYEIGQASYRKTRQNLATAFAFNGIGVAAATTGLVHPVFAMIAMVLSVSAVLVNSFGEQLLSGEGVTTEFVIEGADSTEIGDEQPAAD